MLLHLVARAGRLVTKHELLSALWPEVVVREAALAVCVHELRDALGDDSRHPRYIETQHRKGYRFIAQVTSAASRGIDSPTGVGRDGSFFVGRHQEMARLMQSWQRASCGHRQVMVVRGEPGIGKTTLVDQFLAALEPMHQAALGRGQCVQLFGETEPYHPLREALGRVCRTNAGSDLKRILCGYAPRWASDMPGIVQPSNVEAVRSAAGSVSQPRMMREMALALEVFSEARPLVLVFEDLHLIDPSTAQLLVYLAQRRGSAQLLIIGTCRSRESVRPARNVDEAIRQLRRTGQFEELRLGRLDATAVAEYVRVRAGGTPVPAGLAEELYRRTEGYPLFMVALTDDLMARNGSLAGQYDRNGIPDSTRELIESHLAALSPADRNLLETASIAGVQFTPAELTSVHRSSAAAIEKRCERLARRGRFIRRDGVSNWPGRGTATRFAFQHGLYQEYLYDRVGAARREQLHRQIGSRIETAYGTHAPEMASELAAHFGRGGDFSRAARYQHILAETALRLSANATAIAHDEKAVSSLPALPQN